MDKTDQEPSRGTEEDTDACRAVMKDREAHRPEADVEGDGDHRVAFHDDPGEEHKERLERYRDRGQRYGYPAPGSDERNECAAVSKDLGAVFHVNHLTLAG